MVKDFLPRSAEWSPGWLLSINHLSLPHIEPTRAPILGLSWLTVAGMPVLDDHPRALPTAIYPMFVTSRISLISLLFSLSASQFFGSDSSILRLLSTIRVPIADSKEILPLLGKELVIPTNPAQTKSQFSAHSTLVPTHLSASPICFVYRTT